MAAGKNLNGRLSKGVVFGDGAMGTMLYQRGVFLNRCYDELNISNPALVRGIHSDYVSAGVDFIETNTFGANRLKLSRFGLADQVEKINEAAVEIAKNSAGSDVLVAGAMGPVGYRIKPYGNLEIKEVISAFRQQAEALVGSGVDFLILETFNSKKELLTAVRAVAEVTDLPVVAQMTVTEQNETVYGKRIDDAIERIAAEPNVTVVGLNCSVGPSGMLSSLELIREVTDKPISVQPNAGLPRRVDDRTVYMCTPEYMAEYAKRFFEKGARVIGGCCGTTSAHIKEIVRSVRAISRATMPSGQRRSVNVKIKPRIDEVRSMVPLAQKSRLGEKLAAGRKVTTIEITPPRGVDLDATLEKARLCAHMNIDAINIPDGPRASLRLSPFVTAFKIQQSAGIETILHVCCRDRNLIGMQSDILGVSAIGLHNLLMITGDPPKLGKYPDATAVFDMDSIALTGVVRDLNCGIDIGGNKFSPPLCLTMGVGVNPVAAELDREIERFRRKVEAGAEFAITQPIFDVKAFFNFLDTIEPFRIPVIAGIWPFTSFKNAEFMANEVPGVVVPDEFLKRMSESGTKQQGRALGVEIAREMVEKIQDRVDGFAASAPLGDVRIALAALGRIDISEI